jgi:hypothetical protein
MKYIGPNELIYYKDEKGDIYSGGFSVNSILMKQGISPMVTVNNNSTLTHGGSNSSSNVSDLFHNLVVPNWLLSYHNGGGLDIREPNKTTEETDSDDDVVKEDLHDKLLNFITVTDAELKVNKKRSKRNKNKFVLTKKNRKNKSIIDEI